MAQDKSAHATDVLPRWIGHKSCPRPLGRTRPIKKLPYESGRLNAAVSVGFSEFKPRTLSSMFRSIFKNKTSLALVFPKLASLSAPLFLAAVAATPAPVAAQTIVVFGDSSADLGSQGPDRRPTNRGDMWSEALAKRVGKTSTFARSLSYDADGNLISNKFTGGNS